MTVNACKSSEEKGVFKVELLGAQILYFLTLSGPAGASPVTILLVEDDDSLRYVRLERLRRNFGGAVILEAADGETALKIFTDRHVDIVITDFIMLKIDGVALIRQLRESGYAAAVIMSKGRRKRR